jgi:acyl-CoA synthetase (AMP-forming)/AMP-acid ligase II/acyl carrier protein
MVKTEQLPRGSRVILVYPPSLDFIVAFLGCLKAGLIAVPVFPPDPSALHKDLTMFANICENCGATTALTCRSYDWATKIATINANWSFTNNSVKWPELKWITSDSIMLDNSYDFSDSLYLEARSMLHSENEMKEVAFLQYTSGSTSDPKGVMISHSNLDHNIKLIHTGLAAGKDTVVVSWLPQYHDMGLIGSYLACICCGGSGYYMSPITFIRNPPLWIKCISKYRGTHMQAPDFAYSLTAKKFLALNRNSANDENKKYLTDDIDLSCVQHMINAAEPVQRKSIIAFETVFASYGLPRGRIYPTYGLAEHTVYVCSNGKTDVRISASKMEKGLVEPISRENETGLGSLDNNTLTFPGCGKLVDSSDVQVEIVVTNGDGTRSVVTNTNPAQVGEIWIRSPSVALGYWGMNESTPENSNFCGTLPETGNNNESNRSGEAPQYYLRTGDLGFIHDGELMVCGRQKDLIVIRGKNHYPQDIERTAESVNASVSSNITGTYLRPGCTAAFHITAHGKEGFGIVAEITDDIWSEIKNVSSASSNTTLSGILSDIRKEIINSHGITPSFMALLKPRCIIKTTSGKIARSKVRAGALNQALLGKLCEWSESDIANSFGNSSNASSSQPSSSLESFVDDEIDGFAPPVAGASKMDLREGGVAAVDPTGMPLRAVKSILEKEVKSVLEIEHGKEAIANLLIDWNAPIQSLGIDSMMGVQLIGNLESRFTIPIPEQLFAEHDCSLLHVALCLVAGGRIRSRPYLINTWELCPYMASEIRKNVRFGDVEWQGKTPAYHLEKVSDTWLREKSIKSDLNTLTFPKSSIIKHGFVAIDENGNRHIAWMQWLWTFLCNDNLMNLVRIMPIIVLLWMFVRTHRWTVRILIFAIGHWVIQSPNRIFLHNNFIDAKNLITLQCSKFLHFMVQFMNHRFIVEAPIDASTPALLLVQAAACKSVTSNSDRRSNTIYQKVEFTDDVPIAHIGICLSIIHAFVRVLLGFQVKTVLPEYFKVEQEWGIPNMPGAPKTKEPVEMKDDHSHWFLQKYASTAWMRSGFIGNYSNEMLLEDQTRQGVYGSLAESPHLCMLYENAYDKITGKKPAPARPVPGNSSPSSNFAAIRLALIKGYQIVPVLHLQDPPRRVQVKWNERADLEDGDHDPRGMLHRKTMVCITGRPIQCPRVCPKPIVIPKDKDGNCAPGITDDLVPTIDLSTVTDELVLEYDEIYNKEIRRMAKTHGDMFFEDPSQS